MNPAKNADEPTFGQGFVTGLKTGVARIAAPVVAVGIIFAVPAAGSEEMPETRLGTAAGPSQAGQPLGWTGGKGAYAGGSGSQSGSGGSTTQSSSNSGDMGRDTPLVYKSQSSGPPVFDSGVWTGDEGGVQFVQVADPGKKGTAGGPPQSEGDPQTKSWSKSFWDWFMGPDPAKGSLWKLGPADVLRAGDSGTHNNRKSQVESLEDGGKYTKIIIDGAINDGALAGAGAVVGKLGAQNGISPSSNNAFKAAQAGRKHAGFLKNYAGKSASELKSGIASLQKQIGEHTDKIANPEKYIPNFKQLDPRQQAALLRNKWPSDIARLQEQADILPGLLKLLGGS